MSTTSTRQRDNSSRNIVLAFVGLVLVAIAIAVSTTSGQQVAEDLRASAWGEPAVTGEVLPPFVPGEDAAVGMPGPVVVGVGMAGEDVTIGGSGPQVIAFLAHWCSHCRAEVPVMVDWLGEGRQPAGVEFLSVATSTDEGQPNFPPQDWLATEGWEPPVLLDDQDSTAASAYGLTSFPYFVVLDADGTVVFRVAGELTPDQLDALFAVASNGS